MKLFRGTVTQTQRSTSGWGESEKIVGVDVSVKIEYIDNEGDKYHKTIVVHLPKELGQPLVGDDVFVGWEPALLATYTEQVPPVDSEEDLSDVEPDPNYGHEAR